MLQDPVVLAAANYTYLGNIVAVFLDLLSRVEISIYANISIVTVLLYSFELPGI